MSFHPLSIQRTALVCRFCIHDIAARALSRKAFQPRKASEPRRASQPERGSRGNACNRYCLINHVYIENGQIIPVVMRAIAELAMSYVIRPTRADYDPAVIPETLTVPDFGEISRMPVSFENGRGQKMVGSLYRGAGGVTTKPYAVVYCHGSSESQIDGQSIVPFFVPVGISVFCFDFAGSGKSDGEYISLGWFEHEDLTYVIELLRDKFGFAKFALWGRSMGAVAAIYALGEHAYISSAVLDSPFASLPEVIVATADRYGLMGCRGATAMNQIRRAIQDHAHFDINRVKPIKKIKDVFSPVFVIHAKNDTTVDFSQGVRVFEAIEVLVKEFRSCDGDHNDPRPGSLLAEVTRFVCAGFGLEITFE